MGFDKVLACGRKEDRQLPSNIRKRQTHIAQSYPAQFEKFEPEII
jgi:hypothetical protein